MTESYYLSYTDSSGQRSSRTVSSTTTPTSSTTAFNNRFDNRHDRYGLPDRGFWTCRSHPPSEAILAPPFVVPLGLRQLHAPQTRPQHVILFLFSPSPCRRIFLACRAQVQTDRHLPEGFESNSRSTYYNPLQLHSHPHQERLEPSAHHEARTREIVPTVVLHHTPSRSATRSGAEIWQP